MRPATVTGMSCCRIVAISAPRAPPARCGCSGWRAQPAKSVPSYSSGSLVVIPSEQLERVLHDVLGLLVGQEWPTPGIQWTVEIVGVGARQIRALDHPVLRADKEPRRDGQALLRVLPAGEPGSSLNRNCR